MAQPEADICSARRTALGPTRASSELSKVSAMPMGRTIYFRFPQPSALGRVVVWCVVRGARAHGRASRPRGGRGSRRRGPAARRFCQIIEKQRFEKGYRTLLTYYMLGSDPALWPAGERRERGFIMHDKGYYHSCLGRSRKGTFRPYQTPEPQPRGAVTRRAVAQRRSRASGLTRPLAEAIRSFRLGFGVDLLARTAAV